MTVTNLKVMDINKLKTHLFIQFLTTNDILPQWLDKVLYSIDESIEENINEIYEEYGEVSGEDEQDAEDNVMYDTAHYISRAGKRHLVNSFHFSQYSSVRSFKGKPAVDWMEKDRQWQHIMDHFDNRLEEALLIDTDPIWMLISNIKTRP